MQSANDLFTFMLFRWGRRFLAFSFCLFFTPTLLQAQLFLPPVNYQAGIAPRCMVAKDFNGDGKLDIATSDWGGNTVSVLIGNGLGALSAPTAYAVGQVPQRIASADINADGYMDLVTTNFSSNSLSVLYGLGNGQFSQADSIYVGLKPYDLVLPILI
ncbi:MAG: VCBS repeat-containing protein [Chitinophagaceae bacterium]|nr:VCBS repeat-containing protein [Chitinophagaceae bacterium]